MRLFVVALVAVLGSVPSAFAAEIEATSSIDSVTVYPDGATVSRILKLDLPAGDHTVLARDFPLTLDPASLRVEGESGTRLQIGSIDARPPAPRPVQSTPEREKKIQVLEDEKHALDDRIAAAEVHANFARRFATEAPLGLGEDSNARPLAEWRDAFKAMEEEINQSNETIRGYRLRQRDIDAELAILRNDQRADPPRKLEVRIDLSAEAATTARLRVSYTVRDARWVPLYDARLKTGDKDHKPTLELVRRAEIVQHAGEDWANVALAVSTTRTARGGSAPDLPSMIVRFPEPPRPLAQSMAPAQAPMARSFEGRPKQADGNDVRADERSAEIETGGFQVLFRIPGRISLGAGEGARSLRIASLAAEPDLLVRAAPAIDATAYLEASFKENDEAPLLPGRVALYRDGSYVGQGRLALTQKDEIVRLGFGADDQVKVERVVVRKNEGTSGLISSSKTDEREFKITLRNGHAQPITATIEDQLPVSETADIQVETLPSTTPPSQRDVHDQRGVMAWSQSVPPGEVHEIRFGWRVRWPSDKSVVFAPGR